METNEITLELERWRGWSAYESAVRNGFVGDEEAWLDSLRGKDGLVDCEIANHLGVTEPGYALDARQGHALKALVDEKASTARYTAVLPAAGWSDAAPFEQTVSVPGVLATDDPFADIDVGAVEASREDALEAWSLVGRIETADGSVTATCYTERPTLDLPILLKVVR